MQTGEYHGFAGQFPNWLRMQLEAWCGPLLLSILIHVCLFWPKGLSQNEFGAAPDIGKSSLHARLMPASSSDHPVGRVTQPEPVRHATVTQASSRKPAVPVAAPLDASDTPAAQSAAMTVSIGLDAGAQRSYRLALARLLMAEELRRRLHDPAIAGALEVGIALSASGQLRDVALLRGSGSAVLDAAVVAAVRQAAQTAPIPMALQGRDFVIAVPVEIGAAAMPTSVAGR